MRRWLAFALAWVVILGGSFLASNIQTSGARAAGPRGFIPCFVRFSVAASRLDVAPRRHPEFGAAIGGSKVSGSRRPWPGRSES